MANANQNENVGVALALVFGAGLSTGIGAVVVFIPSLVKIASRRVLASSLGFSAGVMTYVSFVEILNKSTNSFEAAGHDANRAYLYSTLCFFGGVVAMLLLNMLVELLLGRHGHDHYEEGTKNSKKSTRKSVNKELVEGVTDGPPCCSTDPVRQLDTFQRMASVIEHEIDDSANEATQQSNTEDQVNVVAVENDQIEEKKIETADEENIPSAQIVEFPDENNENERLHKMGLNTALAIGLHNFPEGTCEENEAFMSGTKKILLTKKLVALRLLLHIIQQDLLPSWLRFRIQRLALSWQWQSLFITFQKV